MNLAEKIIHEVSQPEPKFSAIFEWNDINNQVLDALIKFNKLAKSTRNPSLIKATKELEKIYSNWSRDVDLKIWPKVP